MVLDAASLVNVITDAARGALRYVGEGSLVGSFQASAFQQFVPKLDAQNVADLL